jgi:uridylate kinase
MSIVADDWYDSEMEPIILKIGGSLLSKSDDQLFDFAYFAELKTLLTKLSQSGYKFVISVGGGYVTRKYQQLISAHGEHDTVDLHKVGVATTNLNAEIFHGLLDELALPEIMRYADFDNFLQGERRDIDFGDKSIQVISSSKPGKSNDWNALQFALKLNSGRVIDVKNIDGVYTSDPKKDPSAQKVAQLTWEQYLEIIGNPTEHIPGANYPVDPIAAREAQAKGIEFVIVSGFDLSNLEKLIVGQEYSGSVVRG